MRIPTRARRAARRLYQFCLVDGALDEARARLVVERVLGMHLGGSIAVLSHFHRLVRLDLASRHAVVESAAPVAPDVVSRLESAIAGVYGPATTTTVVENPALIGGMRIQVGSDVYDGSIRAALARLSDRF
jgi:F-type H+-transporting ATPase subunit delta